MKIDQIEGKNCFGFISCAIFSSPGYKPDELMPWCGMRVHLVFGAWSSADEKTIRGTIFSTASYDRLTRPSEITYINVAFNLLAINSLDIKTQQFSCIGWLTMEWTDSRLTWTVTTGTESNYVFAKNTEIWFPEVFVDNSLADVDVINNDDLLYKVKYDGTVDWEVPRIFTTYCEVDITYFPFDTQTCTVEVTSWAYNKDEMRLQHLKTEVNVEDFKQHGEFINKSSTISTSELQETQSDGTVEYFTQLSFNMVLERRPSYYILSLILPVVLTSCLMIIVFILPVHSGEKVGFALTVLLAVAVLLTLILDTMPSTALYTSVLSIFLMSNLVMNVISVFCTIIVIYIYHRDEKKKPSRTINSIMTGLAKLSCWNGCGKNKQCHAPEDKTNDNENENNKNNGKQVKVAFEENNVNMKGKEYSWKEISLILDWFFFVYTAIFTALLTTVFMMALAIGGTVNK